MNERRTTWRLLRVPTRAGAENMARDSGLMDRARETGESVLAVYGWRAPTLSLGRNQLARGRYDTLELRRRGVDVVRRPTGGRALLHHREVTYSVTAPVRGAGPLTESYRRINRMLIEGLRKLGIEAVESASEAPTPQPGTLPCFASPGAGELVTNGSKLVGSAQVREKGTLLQHGSILIDDDQPLIAQLLLDADFAEPVPPAATLRSALGREPSADEVCAALFAALGECEDTTPVRLDESDTSRFTARHIERFRSDSWTWRR